jgi:hypothetical protein
MRLVLLLEESSWKSKNLENGTRERKISRDCKMKDLISSRVRSLKEKKKLRRSMLRELKKLD